VATTKKKSADSAQKRGGVRSRKREATLIGVLASRDDPCINRSLGAVLEHLYNHGEEETLSKFHFIFTGGTYDRIFNGNEEREISAIDPEIANWYRRECGVTRLPEGGEGGVTLLNYLITQRKCSIVWAFFAPMEIHWLRPENLALMRLCDQCHVKRLMNRGSVLVWFDLEAVEDAKRNLQPCPPRLTLFPDHRKRRVTRFFTQPAGVETPWRGPRLSRWTGKKKAFKDMTLALIAHDEMKDRMIDFAIDHESEIDKFGRILATGTTGREVAAATSRAISDKLIRAHSGPKGGDIEIATAVLHDKCDVVIFFMDPLTPHPHIEDIRVVFEACMVKDQVVMITNERHAREFMCRVVRGEKRMRVYP